MEHSETFNNAIICAGKNCSNIGVTKLLVHFIKKKGYFCKDCAIYLLNHDLAIEIEEN